MTSKLELHHDIGLEHPKINEDLDASRNFLVSLRPHPKNKFTTSKDEINKICDYVKHLSGFKYTIIAKEKNPQTDDYHYHVLVVTTIVSKQRRKQTLVNDLKHLFPNNLQTDHSIDIRFISNNKRRVIAYICKQDDYTLFGDISHAAIDKIIKSCNLEIIKTKKILSPKEEREEKALKFVIDLMKNEKIKINHYTHMFMNFGSCKDFYSHLVKRGFLDMFCRKDLETIQSMFNNYELYSEFFPFFKPNLSIWKYSDGYIDLYNNKVLTIAEGDALLALNNEDPILDFGVALSREPPIHYIKYVSRFMFPDQFNLMYRELLLPPNNESRCLYFESKFGNDENDMMMLYRFLMQNVISKTIIDRRFPFESVARSPKYAFDENTLFSKSTPVDLMFEYKKIITGQEHIVKSKKLDNLISVTKNGMIKASASNHIKSLYEEADIKISDKNVYLYREYQSIKDLDPKYLIAEASLIIPYLMLPISPVFSGFRYPIL